MQTIKEKRGIGVLISGDAGYRVSVSLGQGTTVAMVGAYVLAGELATHKHDLQAGLKSYENGLRPYVEANQKLAYVSNFELQEANLPAPENIPDFTQSAISFELKKYAL